MVDNGVIVASTSKGLAGICANQTGPEVPENRQFLPSFNSTETYVNICKMLGFDGLASNGSISKTDSGLDLEITDVMCPGFFVTPACQYSLGSCDRHVTLACRHDEDSPKPDHGCGLEQSETQEGCVTNGTQGNCTDCPGIFPSEDVNGTPSSKATLLVAVVSIIPGLALVGLTVYCWYRKRRERNVIVMGTVYNPGYNLKT